MEISAHAAPTPRADPAPLVALDWGGLVALGRRGGGGGGDPDASPLDGGSSVTSTTTGPLPARLAARAVAVGEAGDALRVREGEDGGGPAEERMIGAHIPNHPPLLL